MSGKHFDLSEFSGKAKRRAGVLAALLLAGGLAFAAPVYAEEPSAPAAGLEAESTSALATEATTEGFAESDAVASTAIGDADAEAQAAQPSTSESTAAEGEVSAAAATTEAPTSAAADAEVSADDATTEAATTDAAQSEEDLELLANNAQAKPLSFSTTVATGKKKVTASIASTFVNNATYLFLPAHADITKVALSFTTTDGSNTISLTNAKSGSGAGATAATSLASGSTINLNDFTKTNDAWVIDYRLSGSTTTLHLYIMMSANVRSMYLVSEDPTNKGRAYIEGSKDHSTKAKGTMLLVDPDGTVVYNGELSQIKGRGNSTWTSSHAQKKPYQIKIGKKTDLLETGDSANKAKTWILLANAADPTLVKNTIAYKLGKALGLEGTPECAPIDLYYDGEYRGTYLLCEKVQINSGRVDITNMEDATTEANGDTDLSTLKTAQAKNKYGQTFQFVMGVKNPADTTGGYLVELDTAYCKSERCWFTTSSGCNYAVKEPENLSYEQMLYISEYMESFTQNCNSNASEANIEALSDASSIARLLLVNELSKNPDFCGSSTYFYLPSKNDSQGHVLYGGPLWDFDTAFGVRIDGPSPNFGDFTDPTGLFYQNLWLTNNTTINAEQKKIFTNEMLPLLKTLVYGTSSSKGMQSLDAMVAEVSASQKMNQVLWGLTNFGNSAQAYDTYQKNVDYLKTWLTKRVSWMEKNFASTIDEKNVALKKATETQMMHRLYNPFTGEHFYTASTAEKNSLVNLGWTYEGVGWSAPKSSGTPVYRLYNKYAPGGDHHYTTNLAEKNALVKAGWTYEGVGWYSDDAKGVPLYRQYNPYAQTGTHNYTASKAENDKLVTLGWRSEGIAWYGVK